MLEVRIERLLPMRVAAVREFGENPESRAWERLRAWAEPRDYLSSSEHPVFGFNNPSPAADSKEYGYEFWMQVDTAAEPSGTVHIKDYEGGRFAVTTCRGYPSPESWKELWDWVQNSPYKWRKTHELERILGSDESGEEPAFDLYLPIED